MKKIKVIRIILAILTLIFGSYTAFAMYNVWGDKLLYYDSKRGYMLSVSYKWAAAIFIILIAVNIILAVIHKKKTKAPE